MWFEKVLRLYDWILYFVYWFYRLIINLRVFGVFNRLRVIC